MWLKCREMPGSAIDWIWVEEANGRTCTLTTRFPYFRDREWWDFEQKDDPDWCLFDDRSEGNNVVWEYKTSDLDLVIEIVHMMQSNARKAADKARAAEEHADDDSEVLSLFSSPVFPEYLEIENQEIDANTNLNEILPSLAYNRYSGCIEVRKGEKEAVVFYEYGTPIHALMGNSFGDNVIRELVSWQSGIVTYAPNDMTDARSVTRPFEWLQREGMALMQQKVMLARMGLAYESYLQRTVGSDRIARELVLQRQIIDRLIRKRTLTDILRDLMPQTADWVTALSSLVHQGAVVIKPPTQHRSQPLHFSAHVDEQATNLYSAQTGLLKYESFLMLMQREFQLFKDEGVPLALIVLELRNKGDPKNQWLSAETAALVGHRIELLKRPVDTFSHYQMLDYALLLPNTNTRQAEFIAQRVIHTLSLRDDRYSLGIACGVAALPACGNDMESLITSATKAKDQAKQWRAQLVMAEQLSNVESFAVHPAFRQGSKHEENQHETTISMKDLLIRAALVSPENYETAVTLSGKMHMPIARVLSLEGHIHQNTVEAASQVHMMVTSGQLSVHNGIKALKLMGNHQLDLDTALKRLGTVKQVSRKHKLGELFRAAGILNKASLDRALRTSASAGLPLGCVLVSKGVISQYTLHAGLTALKLVKEGMLTPAHAVNALKGVHSGHSSLKQYLRENDLDISEPNLGVGELLLQGRLISDSELTTAREIELVEKRPTEISVVDLGFVSKATVDIANQLLPRIDNGSLSRDQAAQVMQISKNRTDINDIERLLVKMSQLQIIQQPQTGCEQAPVPRPAPPAQSAPQPSAPPPPPQIQSQPLPQSQIQSHSQPHEVDRAQLLKAAGFISDGQIAQTSRLASASGISLIRMLFDTGAIDQPALNMSGAAKRLIEAGEINIETAVRILRYCKENNVSFDEGRSKVG